jgi:membrane dipeptidase
MPVSAPIAAGLLPSAIIWDNVWPLEPEAGNDYDTLLNHAKAGVNVVSVTIAGDQHNISQAFQRTAAARRAIRSRSETLQLVQNIDDVFAAKLAGRLAVVLHFEGTRCFERDLAVIEAFYQLGVRQTLLAFNVTNSVGGGCADAIDGGLTGFGRQVVREMQQVGMLMDLSHTGHRTSLDAIELARKPCVFSHSNVHAIHPHIRNLRDDQIRGCAATGGVIGISGSNAYLGDDGCSSEAMIRHIDYIVELVGPAHVGFGLDLVNDHQAVTSYAKARPDEWPFAADPAWGGFRFAKAAQIGEVAQLLLARGYTSADVSAILGGNFLRVCKQNWC